MKLTLASLAISSVLFASCYHAQDSLSDLSQQNVTFELELEGYTQESLTRAFDAPTNVVVFDSYMGTVTATPFTSLSNVTMPLQYGVHDLYFVASSRACSSYDLSAKTMTWTSDSPLSTTWGFPYQITVGDNTTFESIHLPLVVSRIQIQSLDKVLSSAKTMTVEAPDASWVLDLTTMKAASTGKGVAIGADISSYAGTRNLSFSINTFVPSATEPSVGDIALHVYDASKHEITSRTLSSVPVTMGKITSYKGYVFSDGITIPFTYDTDWLDTIDKTF